MRRRLCISVGVLILVLAGCSDAVAPRQVSGPDAAAFAAELEAIQQRVARDEVSPESVDPNFSYLYADVERGKVVVGLAHVTMLEEIVFALRYGPLVVVEQGTVDRRGAGARAGTILRA